MRGLNRFTSLCIMLLLGMLPSLLTAILTQKLNGEDSLSVGTPFTLNIQSEQEIKQVIVPDSISSFAILSSKSMHDGKSWQLSIAPLKTGALSFPRLKVITADSTAEQDSTDAFRVHVLSILAEGDTLLRDIKPLQRYSLQVPWWMYLLLLLLLIILVAYLLLTKAKKQAPLPKPVTPPLAPPKPAWEIALQALQELLQRGLPEREDAVLFHYQLSDILRSFLEATYRFPAMEMTVSEITRYSGKRRLNRYDELINFLSACDMVKFAKAQPSKEEIQNRVEWLRSYLQSFIPKTGGVGL